MDSQVFWVSQDMSVQAPFAGQAVPILEYNQSLYHV